MIFKLLPTQTTLFYPMSRQYKEANEESTAAATNTRGPPAAETEVLEFPGVSVPCRGNHLQ